jgi:hypothetical protein
VFTSGTYGSGKDLAIFSDIPLPLRKMYRIPESCEQILKRLRHIPAKN